MKITRCFVLLVLIITICLSCRKEETIQKDSQDIQVIASQAKAYYESQVTDTTLIKPLWSDARLFNGNQLQVPVLTAKSSHTLYDYRRTLIFNYSEGNISNGKIIEVYGKRDVLSSTYQKMMLKDNAIAQSGFDGAVIYYDLKYRQESSAVFKNGVKINAHSSVQRVNQRPTSPEKQMTVTCTSYYWVTHYSDGSQDWQLLATYCDGVQGPPSTEPESLPPDGGSVNVTEPMQITEVALPACLKSALDSIKNLPNGSVAAIIKKFAGNVTGYNWEVTAGTLGAGTNGQTSSSYNTTTGKVTTIFDNQKFTLASDLAVARTILHESVHAYLVAYYNTNRPAFLGTYSQLVQDWQVYNNWNDTHHAEFVRSYVNEIGIALHEFGLKKGYNFTAQFYQDLAWGGLTHIVDANNNVIEATWFINAIPNATDRLRIKDNISAEQYGVDSNGNTQAKKGNNSGC